MADRTALSAGIAMAGIAAVVAATPALITPNYQDLQVTSAAAAAKQVSADVQLSAFTIAGFLSAFADGYLDPTYAPTATPDGGVPTVSGDAGAIYYTLDNLLPAAFNLDDHFFTSDSDLSDGLDLTNFYTNSLIDLGVDPDIAGLFTSFLSNPIATALAVVGLPPEVFDFINNPITTVTDAISPALTAFIEDPIRITAGILAGPDAVAFLTEPIGTVLAKGGPLGVAASEFLNHPFETVASLLGPDALAFVQSPVQEIARVVAAALAQLPGIPGVNNVTALKSSSVQTLDVASTEKTTPKLFKVDLPTPDKFVSDVENAFTPKTKAAKVTVDAVSADAATDVPDVGADTPATPKLDLPKLPTPTKAIADFNDGIAKTAKTISDSLTPKPKKDTAGDTDKAAPAAAKSADSKPDKPKGFGGFGGFKHHEKKATASAGAAG